MCTGIRGEHSPGPAWLAPCAVLLILSLVPACAEAPPPPPSAAELRRQLHEHVAGWLADGETARDNGYTYAVDVGQLLTYAALSGDRELYTRLRDFAVTHLILDEPDDAYTRGFVVWRVKPGEPLDATGTTEALRMAEGLWRGAAAFDLPQDRERAVTILRGYARHAGEDQGVWLIRNYFNLGTRAFATNSFMVDYDPDLVAEVAEATGDAELAQVAAKSYELVRRAAAPSGLLYDMVQPEVVTLMPDLGTVVFSPNDVVQVSNAATVAERAVRGELETARRVLGFAVQRREGLRLYYLGRSGEPVPDAEAQPGPETYAVLVRLAAKLGDGEALEAFTPALLRHAGDWGTAPREPRLYTASELLLALQALESAAAPGPPRS